MSATKGIILAVNIADSKGRKKTNVGCGLIMENFGLQKDAHAGSDRQVSLLAKESIEKIRQKGLDVRYGDFAENLTTEGIDLPFLPVGAHLQIGSQVLLEVTPDRQGLSRPLPYLLQCRRLRHAPGRYFCKSPGRRRCENRRQDRSRNMKKETLYFRSSVWKLVCIYDEFRETFRREFLWITKKSSPGTGPMRCAMHM